MEKYGALNETAKTLKLCKCSVERIVERRQVRASKRGKLERKPNFGKVDDFWRNLIRETIHSFYKKTALAVDVIYEKLKEISAYGQTTLYHLLKNLGF